MSEYQDFLRADRPIAETNYWQFGRIFALLGIWFQIGLLLYMIAGVVLQQGETNSIVTKFLLVVAVGKNLWLFLYCRSQNLIDDRTAAWLAALGADLAIFFIAIPVIDKAFLHDNTTCLIITLHYALAACLRWRSGAAYLALLLPSAFFAVGLYLGSWPVGWKGSLAQLVLGLVFIAAAREALLRDTRRVEEQARLRHSQQAAVVVATAERVALLGGALDIHRTGLSPLRRLGTYLRLADELEAARLAEDTAVAARVLLGDRLLTARSITFHAMLGTSREELALHGIRLESKSLPELPDSDENTGRDLVAFLRRVAHGGQTIEIVNVVTTSRGDLALELDSAGLNPEGLIEWQRTGRVEISSDQRSLLFHLGGADAIAQ